jgi:hypothetical protein
LPEGVFAQTVPKNNQAAERKKLREEKSKKADKKKGQQALSPLIHHIDFALKNHRVNSLKPGH